MAFVKPTRVARFGGTSSTETANSAEPSSGKKDIGWALSEPPPSSFFNWLAYRAYKWFRWLDERMADGVTAFDFDVQGVDGGAGTDIPGGDLGLSGGQATGDESSRVVISAATAGAAGAGTRTPEPYISAAGDLGSEGVVFAAKPVSVLSSVAGEPAVAIESTQDFALLLKGKTVAPTRAALGIEVQNSDPSSPVGGSVYANASDQHLTYYNGVSSPARFQNLDPLIKTLLADSDAIANSVVEKIFELSTVDIEASIPANTLRVGSVIRIRAGGGILQTGTPTITLNAYLNGVGGTPIGSGVFTSSADNTWLAEILLTIRTLTSGGTFTRASRFSVFNTIADERNFLSGGNGSIDVTGANTIGVAALWGTASASNSIHMKTFTVEVL